MERRRNVIENQPPTKCLNCPSFSSTLLDAIYRSIDETDADSRGATKQQLKQKPTCFAENRRTIPPATIPRRAAAEPASRLPPIRTAPQARSDRFASSGIDEKTAAKDRQGSIRSYLRDLRNGRSPRLTNFLTSIFAAKSKVSAELPCSRSCLSKTPSTGKRTVRFCPVSVIVGEDSGGEKWVCKKQGMKKSKMEGEEEEEEEDLFELKNLAFIGRFRDELPVYANVAAVRGG